MGINLEKELDHILNQHRASVINTDKARRLILVLTGHLKTSACKLNRLQKECSLFLYTKGGCDNCGNKC